MAISLLCVVSPSYGWAGWAVTWEERERKRGKGRRHRAVPSWPWARVPPPFFPPVSLRRWQWWWCLDYGGSTLGAVPAFLGRSLHVNPTVSIFFQCPFRSLKYCTPFYLSELRLSDGLWGWWTHCNSSKHTSGSSYRRCSSNLRVPTSAP